MLACTHPDKQPGNDQVLNITFRLHLSSENHKIEGVCNKETNPPSKRPLRPSLTWTLGEVVEAAVLGPDAAVVAVALPVHTVHPPVGGGTTQVSAPAAFARTPAWHQVVLGQCRNQQQQTDKLLRGSHHHERGGGGSSQRSTPGVKHRPPWFPLRLLLFWDCVYSHRRPSLTLSRTWPWEGEFGNTSPATLGRDCAVPQEPLWPGIPASSLSVSLQKPSDLQSRAPHPSSDHQTVSHVVCVCVLPLSLPPRSNLSTSLQSITHTGGDNEGEGGVSRSVFSLLFSLSLSLPLSLFLTCLPLVYLFSLSASLRAELLWARCEVCPPQTSKSQKKGRNVSGWQVSSRLCQGGPLSIVKPPPLWFSPRSLSGYCNVAEITSDMIFSTLLWKFTASFVLDYLIICYLHCLKE